MMLTRLALITATLIAVLAPNARGADPGEKTKELIAVLQSNASLFEKARACQQLGEVGTADAVPVLGTLLTDSNLNAYARSGLEGIPDPSAAAVLRDAAQKLKGPLLAGVVNSLGALRDSQAVGLLCQLAVDPASSCKKEALLALGNISTTEAIRFLQQKLTTEPDPSRGEVAAACLLAADKQRTSGDRIVAAALYDLIRQAKVPASCRVGATRGAILARNADRVPFLMAQLRSGDLAIRNAAFLTIREIPDDTLATALNAEIPRSTAELQGQLLLALVDCHNAHSIAVIQALGDSPNSEIRKTALTALGRIGAGAAPALIAALHKDRPPEEKSAVLRGLRAMEGATVDELLLQALVSADLPGLRIDLTRLLDDRGVANAAPEILKQTTGQDKNVVIAGLSALKSLASPQELPALIALAKVSADQEVKDAAANAVAGVCSRYEEASETVLRELTQSTKSAERNLWIGVLVQVGYAKALPAIEAATSDQDLAVADNALAQLGHWPNPAPVETLLNAMDTGANPALRKTGLAAVLDLAAAAADESQQSDAAIVQWLQRANARAQSLDEKRRILSILGHLKTAESFRLLASYLDNPELRTEAASGVVQIAPALAKGPEAGALKAALEKIASTVTNADLRNRALEVAKTIPAHDPPAVGSE